MAYVEMEKSYLEYERCIILYLSQEGKFNWVLAHVEMKKSYLKYEKKVHPPKVPPLGDGSNQGVDPEMDEHILWVHT